MANGKNGSSRVLLPVALGGLATLAGLFAAYDAYLCFRVKSIVTDALARDGDVDRRLHWDRLEDTLDQVVEALRNK